MASANVLLLGGSGLVGSCARTRWAGDLTLEAPTHAELDVLDFDALAGYAKNSESDVVVNAAAWADVDGAEPESGNIAGRVHRLNVDFPEKLATLCGELRKHLIHVSTDYVFDGANSQRAYTEDDQTRPLCWYAETKRRGEEAVLRSGARACVARIEMPFTGREHTKRDLSRIIAARLTAGQTLPGVTDQRITPVFLDDAVNALRRLFEARYIGIVHVAAANWTTPYAFALSVAKRLRLQESLVQPETFERFAQTRAARRPQHSWLDVSRFTDLFGAGILRSVEDELDAWATQFFQSRQ